MHRIADIAVAFIVAATLARPCGATVVDQGQNGFTIQQKMHIAAPTDKVYAALIAPGKWWSSDHTYSNSAANLALDARAGGCFCETLPGGGSVQHATVAIAMPGAMLRLRGPLGPFQGQGVDSALTFSLKAAGDGTDLTLDNVVGGYMQGGFGKWPVAADGMLAATIARLKIFVETGSPDAKP